MHTHIYIHTHPVDMHTKPAIFNGIELNPDYLRVRNEFSNV